MSKNLFLFFIFVFLTHTLFAQEKKSIAKDDTASLQSVTVSAFAGNTKWNNVPASVAIINKKSLQRYDNNSLSPAMNTIAGVRMEERSPGSYRLSIRGSLLRSSFGVRNIKLYWDDIPFTDATGNTYLQSVDVNDIQSAEIIKGCAASYYGANTGGTVVLHANNDLLTSKNVFNASLTGGSYGMLNEQASWHFSGKKVVSDVKQGHLQSDGYRQNSSLRRDVFFRNVRWKINDNITFSSVAFYSNLHYETPGGITQAQMDSLPKLARQPTATLPGAEKQNTGVYNVNTFTGASLASKLGKGFSNITSGAINHVTFKNPFITNYEKRKEWNISARTNFQYNYAKENFLLQANAGAELQYNSSLIDVFGNRAGVADTVQYKDKVHTLQYFLFAQVNMEIGEKWVLQTGISRNELRYNFERTTDPAPAEQIKKSGPTASPRFSVLYKASDKISLYAIAAKGFSPPTLAEVRPSTGEFAAQLKPEQGWNYEAGIKGTFLKNAIEFNASFYYFELKDAIVRRTDSTGADYYINAGGTIQKGVEVWALAHIIRNSNSLITLLSLWNSFTYQPYRFDEYKIASTSYSGNKLTGVPRTINVTGIDVQTKHQYYANLTLNFTSQIPLNDGNTVSAKAYHLLQLKMGRTLYFKKWNMNVFAGADNLLNEIYSLGNDLNALGGRYFNPAPKINFYGGVQFGF